jgi:hypothetical protein
MPARLTAAWRFSALPKPESGCGGLILVGGRKPTGLTTSSGFLGFALTG